MNFYRAITSILSRMASSITVPPRIIVSWLTVLSISLLAACASLPLQRLGESQRRDGTLDVEASEAYLERYPFGKKSDLKRLELAMVYLSPESPRYNESKGRNYLWQLAGHEQSPYRGYAVQFLELQTKLERLHSETVLGSQLLDQQIAEATRLRGEVVTAEEKIADQSDKARHLQVELQSVRAQLRQLEEEGSSKDKEIERLTRELSELKRIDTRQAP